MKKILTFLSTCIIAFACGGNIEEPTSIPNIDLSKEYPIKNILLSDYISQDYIILETTENSMIDDNSSFYVSDDYVIIASKDDIVLFNTMGKYIYSFNRKGRGSNEYLNINNFCVDFNNEEIIIQDINKILFFTFKGDCIRMLPLMENLRINKGSLVNYDDKYLLCSDDTYLDFPDSEVKVNKEPYFLLSKQDGIIKPLPLDVNDRYGDILYNKIEINGKVYTQPIYFNFSKIKKIGGDITISEYCLDTLYKCDNEIITPVLSFSNSNNKKYLKQVISNSNVYLIIDVFEKSVNMVDGKMHFEKKRTFMCNKHNHEVYEILEEDNIKLTSRYNNFNIPSKYGTFSVFNAQKLIFLNNEGKLSGHLKQIATTLNENDNPVLMLGSFNK